MSFFFPQRARGNSAASHYATLFAVSVAVCLRWVTMTPISGFLRSAETKVTSSVISPAHFYVASYLRALVCCTVDHSHLTNVRGVIDNRDREHNDGGNTDDC